MRLAGELRNVAYAERIFFADNGRASTNLAELQSEGILPPGLLYLPFMNYKVPGTNWTISIAKQPPFAGYYVATPTEVLFHPDRWPTAGDVNLERIPAFRPSR